LQLCPAKERQMIRAHRLSATAVAIVCLLGTTSTEILFASDRAASSSAELSTPSADSLTTAKEDVSTISQTLRKPSPLAADASRIARSLAAAPDQAGVFAQRGYRGRGGYSRRHDGAAAALIVGTAAAIAGTALLVYANRPECRAVPTAGGCGYGTKVVGGAMLSAGAVGVTIGALTW
jgi:hypothetical protein